MANSPSDDVERCLKECLGQSLKDLLSSKGEDTTSNRTRITEQQIHEWAKLIYNSMNTPARLYHNAAHVVEVLENLSRQVADESAGSTDPVSKLAVLFHDIIYYSLDRKLSPEQSTLLHNVICENDDRNNVSISVLPFANHQDPAISMVQAVFDMPENEAVAIKQAGVNEFLSALVAVQTLGKILSNQQLLQLAMAIEATIPFRLLDPATGKSPMERLYDRSISVYRTFVVGVTNDATTINSSKTDAESFVSHAVQQAVLVANSDIGVFASPDPTLFIDSNWRLMPEWFPVLLDNAGCSLSDFQAALDPVRQRRLDRSLIFSSFRNVPDASTITQKQQRATSNLTFLHHYIAIRLLTITMLLDLIECISTSCGNAAPGGGGTMDTKTQKLSIRLADLAIMERAAVHHTKWSNDDNIHCSRTWDTDNNDALLYRVLQQGRRMNYPWDSKDSPLAALVFAELGGSQQVAGILEQKASAVSTVDWLRGFPKTVLDAAIKGVVWVIAASNRIQGAAFTEDELSRLLGI